MQGQMMVMHAMEHYSMLDLANDVLEKCWNICFDVNLTRKELVEGDLPDSKLRKMEACQRKCIARHFEVMKLMNGARELREKEALQGLPPGSLSAE
ncbi:hypothetical protein C3747_31g1214c [Trypanosoma cruzi]|uniref:Tim10-like domain-containing protein n=2 Tax=Trypanosoma cruzi TaxID=5693 RepID=Q4D9I4_TRYCC|nr:hypothetical protein, conserved [Trypanosoma cruzi]XP_812159.1 hypothetical protein, conserved [Trypanosoma cruzi]EAN89189.1 hypothetical protein, conserved [Trypanosoma cruzi]EAN90308.1 hypothetical protein, conserved [Trypanosoma cruzi]KAF8299333.1 putative Tim10/DDP family zinc finger [Trypanosoma cruzi]PWV02174.1 hypothetical protein C3747_190g89c [Trypanosoma cruzi]PWV15165.1 hypothetical protein C3747_31g1214c [Trypanosoma cruzi]|eukprot:XP_811040.1 hypothetical protein [Trypanosoma cruzi strain CL Brener]